MSTDSPTAIQGGRRSDPEEVARDRPKVFTPGSPIGMHLRVERVVRIGGDRIIYLVIEPRLEIRDVLHPSRNWRP